MVVHLDELPSDVGWFGEPWDSGCTPDIEIDTPAGEVCRGCFLIIDDGESGTVAKNADGKWIFYHSDCWGEVVEEKRAYIADALEVRDTE